MVPCRPAAGWLRDGSGGVCKECGEGCVGCVVVGLAAAAAGVVMVGCVGMAPELPGNGWVPRKFLSMGKSAIDASIICVNRSSANLAATRFPRQSWSSRSRRPLVTSSWMSRTVRFTGNGMPSRETTG